MMRAIIVLSFVVFGIASAAIAERNMAPTLTNKHDVCPDQPTEPDWMVNIEVRESYKRQLVQQIYRAESMQRIVEAQSCDCDLLYPSWESAEQVFFERYAADDYLDIVAATRTYRRQANELRQQAMPICEAAGNW